MSHRTAVAPPTDVQSSVLRWGLPVALLNENVGCGVQAPVPLGTSLVIWARDEKLTGLLVAACEGGAIALESDDAQLLQRVHIEALRVSLACDATAAEATAILRTGGIESCFLKGLASAHADYPDTSWRNSNDADLLIRRPDLPRATDLLLAHGFHRAEPGLAQWWERRFARAVVFQSREGVEVDLHTTPAVGYFGERLDVAGLFERPRHHVGSGTFASSTLDAPGRFVTSCFALVLSRGGELRLLRDVAQLLLVGDVDWRAARELAGQEGSSVIATAILRTSGVLGLVESHEAVMWARSHAPSPRARRALALAISAEREGWRADARSTLLALGQFDRLRFLLGIGLATRAHREMRGRTMRDQIRRIPALWEGRRV